MKNYKTIIIAGAIAIGLYFLLHHKKNISMTLAQKAAWHDQVSHIMTQMGTTEKIRVLKAARKEKAAAEGTPEQKTQLTPMEMMAALRARAEQIADEREGGNSKQTDARKVYKDELLKNVKSTDQGYSKKKTQEEIYKDFGLWALPEPEVEHVQESEEEPKKQEKKQKPTDQGYSKKKTQEEIYKDFGLWALPPNM